MQRIVRWVAVGAAAALSWQPGAGGAQDAPAWAYPVIPPDSRPAPDLRACESCHRGEGTGGPESPGLAGLPAEYIVQQVADFRSGARRAVVPDRAPASLMIASAKAVSDDELRAAAARFAALKPRRNLKVVESETAAKTSVANGLLVAAAPPAQEPLGSRIVEVPDDPERVASRDPQATYTAYVPPGSVDKGKALATGEGMPRLPVCTSCHGDDLKGHNANPPIAGRSPTYAFRQLYELKSGARAGPSARWMKGTVAKLSPDDMIALAAYLATLEP